MILAESINARPIVDVTTPNWAVPLYRPYPFKIVYGGRHSAKTWGVAQALAILGARKPLRIMCGKSSTEDN